MWNLRWFTLPFEAELPEEKRYFLTLDGNELYHLWYLTKFLFIIPLGLYFLWAFLYFLKNFVFSAKRIQERKYENMYVYYMNQPWAAKIITSFGKKFGPIVFMSFHVGFFVVSAVFAIMGYCSFWIHTILLSMWTTMSIWNGANFYMEYFSKKYEQSLKRLEELEEELISENSEGKQSAKTSTPT